MKSTHRKLISRIGVVGFSTLVGLSLYSIYIGGPNTKNTSNQKRFKYFSSQQEVKKRETAQKVEKILEPTVALVSSNSQLGSIDKPSDSMPLVMTPDDGMLSGVSAELAPNIVADLLGPDDQIIKAFKTEDMNAWIIRESESGENTVYLTTPDDRYVLSGSFLYKKKNGEMANLNQQIANRYSFDLSASTQWDLLADSSYIQEGASVGLDKKIVYAFFDPDCRFCHLSWLAFKPYVDAGDVDLRWIPVAILNKDSKNKVANLLKSQDPLDAFTRAHLAWDFSNHQGPFMSAETMDVESAFKVEKNNQYLKDFGIEVTPSFVYKDDKNKVTVASGAIRLNDIAKLLNVEEIKNNDPRLALLRQNE